LGPNVGEIEWQFFFAKCCVPATFCLAQKYQLTNFYLHWSIFYSAPLQAHLSTLASIKLLISTTLSIPFPPKNDVSHYVCKHSVFILICVSRNYIFSNKVDLSQATSVLISTISKCWSKVWLKSTQRLLKYTSVMCTTTKARLCVTIIWEYMFSAIFNGSEDSNFLWYWRLASIKNRIHSIDYIMTNSMTWM